MDLLDDIVNLLKSLLDYLGFDVNNLDQIFLPLPVRKGRNIRHRSIIRRIGSRLPLKPAKRIQIQNMLLRQEQQFNDSLGSDLSYVSSGGDNLVWIEEDLGNNCVMVRPRERHRTSSPDPEFPEFDERDIFMVGQTDDRTSTPFDMSVGSVSAVSSVDPQTQMKIEALEEELSMLRQQIAQLVTAQGKPVNLQGETRDTGQSEFVVPPPPPLPPASIPPAPPPPPPPPPTPTNGFFKTPKVGKSLSELIQQNKDCLKSAEMNGTTKLSGPPSMADVLKGLGSVKLRAIQRSPGGTPMKEKPKPSENSDPASMIAHALKRKFASRVIYSPISPQNASDKENDYESPVSPRMPFGQHILKKTKKRSQLFQESRNSPSPLKERNQ